MKYTIFKHKTGLLMPVIHPDCVTHSQIKIEECVPISAGFFKFNKIGLTETYSKSESLSLEPMEGDNNILDKVLANCGTSSFLDL